MIIKSTFDRFMTGILAFMALAMLAVACTPADAAEPVSIKMEQATEAYEQLKQVPSLKESAEGLLVKLINSATQAGEFIAGQAPKVVSELVTYNLILSGLGMLVGLLVAGVGWIFYIPLKRTHESAKKISSYYDGGYIAGAWAAVSISTLAGFMIIASYLPDFLKLLFAPRVWLLEYAANLVR